MTHGSLNNAVGAMIMGVVRWFDSVKGYGLIAPDSGDPDVFVSLRAVEQSGVDLIVEDQAVSFRIATENGRPTAVNIIVVE